MALNDGFHCYSEYTERLQERGKMKVTGRILPKFPRAVSYLIFPGMSNGFLILGVLMVINIASSSLAIVTNAWFSIMLSEEESTKAFSIKYILENIGAMVGPVLGTVLVKLDLRFPFYVASASLVLITLIFFVYSKALVSSPVNGKIDVGKTEDLGIGQTMRLLVQDKRLLYFTIGGVLSMMAGLIILIFRSDLLWLTAAIVLLSFWRSGHCTGGVLIYYKDYSKRAERCIPRRTEYDRSRTVHITGPVRIFAERGDCLHDVRRPVHHIGVQPGILPDGILCK